MKSTTANKAGASSSLPENSQVLSFNLNSTGDYLSFLKFLQALESLRRPIKIDSVTLEVNTVKEGKTLVLHAGGRTFYFTSNAEN